MNRVKARSRRELDLLAALRRLGGSARNAELARAMGVSEETVRRTVKSLSKAGEVARVHGGAYLIGAHDEPSFFRRMAEHSDEKRAIAAAVAQRVSDGAALFLDVGSTTAFLAEELRVRSKLMVATNSIGVAQTLVNHNGNRVFLLGGEMHSDERGAFGAVTEAQARRFTFDTAVLSADALCADHGFLYLSPEEAGLAAVVAEGSGRVLMMLDRSKFGLRAPHRGPAPQSVDELVTDQPPLGPLRAALEIWSVRVHTAAADGADTRAKDKAAATDELLPYRIDS